MAEIAEVRWDQYGPCPGCHAEAGAPCVDMRFFSRFCDTPHAKRHKITKDQDASPAV